MDAKYLNDEELNKVRLHLMGAVETIDYTLRHLHDKSKAKNVAAVDEIITELEIIKEILS